MRKKHITIYSFIILVSIVAIWIIKISQEKMPYVDQWTRTFVVTLHHTPTYTFFRWMTELGSKTFVFPFTIIMIVVLWIVMKDYLPAIFFGLGTLGSHLLNQWIKDLIARERPSISVAFNAEGYSFPSGHAMVSIVCYGLLAYFLNEKIKSKSAKLMNKIGFPLLILLIGMSRYVIDVHFLTDIVAGYLFGFLFFLLLIFLYNRMKKMRV